MSIIFLIGYALMATGCQKSSLPGPKPASSLPIISESGIFLPQKANRPAQTSDPAYGGIRSRTLDCGWVTCPQIKECLPDLKKLAKLSGYQVEWVQPDQNLSRYFLSVAADVSLAKQINGFFYWFCDMTALDPDEPPLILCLDKLFSDSARPAAIAGGLYSDPAVVDLLELTLKQVLAQCYQEDILSFILACYRDVFRKHLQNQEVSFWKSQKIFQRIEVTYDASSYHAIYFRILPIG